ncbi:23S rRNA (adenine2503-C2)-methyltransferase [Alkalithermobacter thermoalcaliphilus JW-YL-7 = DSM 7308]|uniref:Probable dual-specificity RNA methyltransferase RlmN n=1 Tax=Alkalithermobacter thermoalcaliphilus JW-YL-7 = DSM 7308 TaxID=1121328 RepID=A0A150FPR7_CLOPD|nr:Ribosomal RNA large subunit methyltransferase N [[Clostridium] paradoxum JW-YL-7 = DSM 7308]SHK96348.1 23S rRNA (adenine2503-C2)-methyltransferase [[Clostridium] paradoxum JW-YL-7 = DSM 7308]
MERIDLKSLTEDQTKEFIKSIGEKPFRGAQIFKWIYKGAQNLEQMTDLSKELRGKLDDFTTIANLSIYKKFSSKIDGTIKYLFSLEDKNIIESVMMKYKHGVSVCISTQVGCRMGCKFCASTIDGLKRNLKSSEMIDQILKIQSDINQRVSNVVLMGSGEPLDNFEQVKQFLAIVNEKNGLNIGYRHITVSTCGLVDKMYKLSDLKLPINLAISLHAATDEKRKEIMPIANAYSIEDILKACRYHIEKTNRRITFEYSLIKGFNDSKEDAKLLAQKLKGLLCHVNLIPVNKIDERDYKKPDINDIETFKKILKKNNIEATVRRSMGSDIQGACGQLRRRNL